MNKRHLAALICFVLAFVLYWAAGSSAGGGGLAFLGFIFEMMAWSKSFGSKNDE